MKFRKIAESKVLQMIGKVPEWMREKVLDPPTPPQPVYLKDFIDEDGNPCRIGRAFEAERQMSWELADGAQHTWNERWLVLKSADHARRQRDALRSRLNKAVDKLNRMRAKSDEKAAQFQGRAEQVVEKSRVEGLLTVTVNETITQKKRYLRPGRPSADTPYKLVEQRKLQLHVTYNLSAIREIEPPKSTLLASIPHRVQEAGFFSGAIVGSQRIGK